MGSAAITHIDDSSGDQTLYIFGRKVPGKKVSSDVWELIPQGNVDREEDLEGKVLSNPFDKTFSKEFKQELPGAYNEAGESYFNKSLKPEGVLLNRRGSCFTVVGGIELTLNERYKNRKKEVISQLKRTSEEHAEIELVKAEDLDGFVRKNGLILNPVSIKILEHAADQRGLKVPKCVYDL